MAKTGQSPSLVGDTPSFMFFFPLPSLVFEGVSLPLGCESLKTLRQKLQKHSQQLDIFTQPKIIQKKLAAKPSALPTRRCFWRLTIPGPSPQVS